MFQHLGSQKTLLKSMNKCQLPTVFYIDNMTKIQQNVSWGQVSMNDHATLITKVMAGEKDILSYF